jgi:hypothetical protein
VQNPEPKKKKRDKKRKRKRFTDDDKHIQRCPKSHFVRELQTKQ